MSFVARAPTEAHLPSLSLFSSSSSTATFTSQLRETLVQSRSIIDTWVVNEKKRVDQHVKEAKQQLVSKQQTIDATSAQLLALQLQHGCRIADDDTKQYLSTEARGSNSNTLSKQQTELESMIEQQTKKNQRLDAQLAELKKEIRGNVAVFHYRTIHGSIKCKITQCLVFPFSEFCPCLVKQTAPSRFTNRGGHL